MTESCVPLADAEPAPPGMVDAIRILCSVAGDPHAGYRVRAAAGLLDLGCEGPWLRLAELGLTADRDTAAHAAGTLVGYGGVERARTGIDAALDVIGAGIDDTAAVLCTRLVVARGTPGQAREAADRFAAMPAAGVSRWEALANMGLPERGQLLRVCDDPVADPAERVRAAVALRGLGDGVAALADIASNDELDPMTRVDAIEELLTRATPGPWADTLAAIVTAHLRSDALAAQAGADLLLGHLPHVAKRAHWSLAADPDQAPATRTRAAASLVLNADHRGLDELHTILHGLVRAADVGPFDTAEAANLLARTCSDTRSDEAVDVLVAIARSDACEEDRYFAAAALSGVERARRTGLRLLCDLADHASARTRLWVAGHLVARPMVHPALWRTL